jgi:hypothetical protein
MDKTRFPPHEPVVHPVSFSSHLPLSFVGAALIWESDFADDETKVAAACLLTWGGLRLGRGAYRFLKFSRGGVGVYDGLSVG